MATQITNKQVKIISDVNCNGNKIIGAKISSTDNEIDINAQQIVGVFYPENNEQLQSILTNNNDVVIDFSKFDGILETNGYNVSNKNFTFQNLYIVTSQQFAWLEKTLFTFTDSFILFRNCFINIGNIEFDNLNNPLPLFVFNATDPENTDHSFRFENCILDVYWLTNISNIKLIKINNDRFIIKNCLFGLYGSYSNSTIIEDNIANSFTDINHTRSEIQYSIIEMYNTSFDNSNSCIRYTTDVPTRLTIKFSNLVIPSTNSIILPNGADINVSYSNLRDITCKEPDNVTFALYNTETTYNEGDALQWIEHYPEAELNPTVGTTYNQGQFIYYNDNMYELRESSECTSPIQNWLDENANNVTSIQWLKVEADTLVTSDNYYDMWSYLENGDISFYYNAIVSGEMSIVQDSTNRISNFDLGGNLRLSELRTNFLEINGHLQSNNTNDFVIKMQDENINGGNETDVLSALRELAANKVNTMNVITDANNANLEIKANTIYDFGDTPISELTLSSAEKSYLESRIYFITDGTIQFADDTGTLEWGGDGSAPSGLEINTKYCIVICNGKVEIDTFGTIA